MQEVQFITPLHISSKRNYLERMTAEKPSCMKIAKQFGYEYWDGDRKYGYGKYSYDGRWKPVAEAISRHYGLKPENRILDIGCGKGFLLYDISRSVPNLKIQGIDISEYAQKNSKLEKVDHFIGKCTSLPWKDGVYDFTYSINALHNLSYRNLKTAIKEMVRVSKNKMYICVESYRTEQELCNLQCWALTCASFYTPEDWLQIYEDCGYSGDYEFIYFS